MAEPKFKLLPVGTPGYHEHYLTDAEQAALLIGGSRALVATHAIPCPKITETHVANPNSRLSDHHLALMRRAIYPGVREIDITCNELRAMLDEIEDARTHTLDLAEQRVHTTFTNAEALRRWRAIVTVPEVHANDHLGLLDIATGFFLGLDFDYKRAQNLALLATAPTDA